MFKFVFFVPKEYLDAVKDAVFSAGGGAFDNYENCCWYTLGFGEFTPQAGAAPMIGTAGHVSQVEEYKVELMVSAEHINSCIAALKLAHPYEKPVYEVFKLEAWAE